TNEKIEEWILSADGRSFWMRNGFSLIRCYYRRNYTAEMMKRCGIEIKLIMSDIDGTLLTSENNLLPSTEKAVRKIIDDRKCAFTLSTGRSIIYTDPLVEYLNIQTPFAFSGGAIIDPRESRVLFAPVIELEQIEKTVVIAEKYNVGILAHTANGMFCQVNDKDWLTIRSLEWMIGRQDTFPKRIEDIGNEVPNEIIRLDLFAEVNWLSKVWEEVNLKVEKVNVIKMSRSIEITDKEMDKGSAIRRISKFLGIPLKNTMAIGDSLNDVSLLEAAGFGVAMETAPECLKDMADALVPSSDEGGLEKALQMIA
ncbi:MAG: HAD family hydrolase, partial [Pelolinea sp.]|nr:HAD family hydrolase [Pelolinea sp.]